MRNVDINLGRRCNLRCQFCLDGGLPSAQRQWVPARRVVEELRHWRAQGYRSVGLLGGEPTAHPELLSLVAEARRLGFERVAVVTNGVRLAEADACDALLSAGVTRVAVSIHSHTRKLEDRLTGRTGSFEAKVAALRNLVAHRRRGRLPDGLSVNAVVSRPTVAHLPAMVRFLHGLGVHDLRFNLIRPWGRALEHEALLPRYRTAARWAERVIAAHLQEPRGQLSFGDFPTCVWSWELRRSPALMERYVGEYHDPDTQVSLFIEPQAPDGTLQRFDAVERRCEELKVKLPACGQCAFDSRCEGPFAHYIERWGPGEITPLGSDGGPLQWSGRQAG